MKKEINHLLELREGTFQINHMFLLRRTYVAPEDDVMGREIDRLDLQILNDPAQQSREITSRDMVGIIDQVEKAMLDMMSEYAERMARRWRGGIL